MVEEVRTIENPLVYNAAVDPNTKLIINMARGRTPSKMLVSYVKSALRRSSTNSMIEKKASLPRPIDTITGVGGDMAGLAASKYIYRGMKGLTNRPSLRVLGTIAGTILASHAATKVLDKGVNVAEKVGIVPSILTRVDDDSNAQVYLGNGLALAGLAAGGATGYGLAAKAGLSGLGLFGASVAAANEGRRIGEFGGTIAGNIYDAVKQRLERNSEPA